MATTDNVTHVEVTARTLDNLRAEVMGGTMYGRPITVLVSSAEILSIIYHEEVEPFRRVDYVEDKGSRYWTPLLDQRAMAERREAVK